MIAIETRQQHPEPTIFRISVDEHFDYRSIHRFRNLSKEKLSGDVLVVVDMAATRYIDSSGVALLPCLLHWIRAPMVIVQVINCCPELRRILSLSRLPAAVVID